MRPALVSPRDPFACNGPTIINVSGGRTSSLMLRRTLDAHDETLPADVHAVFTNTGGEHAGTLEFLAECADRWDVDIRWIERDRSAAAGFREVTYETASRDHQPFEELVTQRRFLPNAVMRFCTQALKIETAAAFMRSQGHDRWTSVVGLRFDEPQRVHKLRARDAAWDVACPLFDAGVTVDDVAAFWRASPFDLRIPAHAGNCVGCFLKGHAKRRRIAEDTPELLAWWASMEERIGARFRKDGPSYAHLIADAAAQGRLHLRVVDDDDLTVCGCTDRRPQRRRCSCHGRGHALSCERSMWAVAE